MNKTYDDKIIHILESILYRLEDSESALILVVGKGIITMEMNRKMVWFGGEAAC